MAHSAKSPLHESAPESGHSLHESSATPDAEKRAKTAQLWISPGLRSDTVDIAGGEKSQRNKTTGNLQIFCGDIFHAMFATGDAVKATKVSSEKIFGKHACLLDLRHGNRRQLGARSGQGRGHTIGWWIVLLVCYSTNLHWTITCTVMMVLLRFFLSISFDDLVLARMAIQGWNGMAQPWYWNFPNHAPWMHLSLPSARGLLAIPSFACELCILFMSLPAGRLFRCALIWSFSATLILLEAQDPMTSDGDRESQSSPVHEEGGSFVSSA